MNEGERSNAQHNGSWRVGACRQSGLLRRTVL
jgi:hypothetical protein